MQSWRTQSALQKFWQCHFKLGKPVHHQNLLWQLLMLSISQKPPIPTSRAGF